MKEFIKYHHIEKLGTTEVEGIIDGECYVFPKIDGTNSSIWLGENGICCGSRKRTLSLDNDNAGFMAWAVKQENILELLSTYPEITLYGEWLIPHTLKTYDDSAWRQFYVFDVVDHEGYFSYEQYTQLLDEYGIEYIPAICKIKNPTYERLTSYVDDNTYLIKDGLGNGEGIVIKNYDFVNRYGRITWAKVVRNDFKTMHRKSETREVTEKKIIEEAIVNEFVTESLVTKEYSKIENESGWSSKMIPRLLQTVFYELIKEECWNFVKKYKNPTINFNTLLHLTQKRTKELLPNLF